MKTFRIREANKFTISQFYCNKLVSAGFFVIKGDVPGDEFYFIDLESLEDIDKLIRIVGDIILLRSVEGTEIVIYNDYIE